MKKPKYSIMLAVLLTMSLILAACGGGGNLVSDNNSGDEQGQKTVTIFQFKTEIVEGLNELKVEFEKEHPNIKLDIQTVGGGADYDAALKTKFASGDAPDIFSNNGYAKLDMWQEKLEDLSDQPWVKDLVPLAAEAITKDSKVYGLPLDLEGFGYVYNKDLFNKAGITTLPKTYSELEAAAKKLQAAGITPFANAYQEWWLVGSQGISVAFANQDDVDGFIKGMNEGTASIVGNEQFANWAKLMKLTLDYGNKNPLTTDYNTQVTMFANGEAAMMQEGNWAQTMIDGITPNMNIGILPMPLSDDAAKTGKVTIGVPVNLVVNKESDAKEEAKIFLNWLVTSDIGKEYLVKKFKFIPAMTTIQATPEDMGPIATDLVKYVEEGNIFAHQAGKFPDGVAQEFGSAIQQYLAGKSDVESWQKNMQAAWDKLK
ncbi:ABC transporter substrate-binding protein [Paenibacillus sp. P96]|uniref:ABC transporter substrate-binding protein n=1 Tax=Paenibacillus zeirhizosphaerae TaxID=2987519 RepID=A0ABT9FRN0_9BACL|nr:ABC transporter substrate-binding protein [Paenibacillus sp. P96]MDP4097360.1 ABC transporter substrate-binding protein [Paenibacillus sp. P96]